MWTVVLFTSIGVAAENQPVAAPLEAQVKQLVRQLDSDQLTQRDEAEQALTKLGPDAISLLPQVGDRTPAEVAQRLARVRQALERAEAALATQPALVTLDGEMPLSEAIAAIAKQTGNRIVDHRVEFGQEASDPKVKLKFAKAPFWQALDEVLDQAHLTVYGFAGERGAYLVNRPEGESNRSGKAAYSGPFRVSAARFEAVRDLRSARNQSLKLFTDVAWEPRIMPIAILQPLDQMRAVGPRGEELAVEGSEGEPEAMVSEDMASVELQFPLSLPSRSVEKIASLKGKLKVVVPGHQETFRFEKLPLAKGNAQPMRVEQRKAGVTVIVDGVKKNQEVWELRMRVRFDEPSLALESHRGWIFSNEAFMVGPDNKKIAYGGYEQTRQTKDEVGIMYLFPLLKGPEGLAFVYKTPTAIMEMPLEYELKDLDLP